MGDLKEREHWDDYQQAYEEAISTTSKEHAPWFIIPADDKWYARLAIASIIYEQFDKLNLNYPAVSTAVKEDLARAREILSSEVTKKKK